MSFLEGCASSASFLQIPYPAMALNQAGVNLEVEMYNTMKVAPGYPADPLLGWVAEVAKGAPQGHLEALVIRCHGGPGVLYIGSLMDINSHGDVHITGGIKPEQAPAFEKVKGLVNDIFLIGCNVVADQSTGKRILSGDDLCGDIAKYSRARVYASAAKQPDFSKWGKAPYQYIYAYVLPAYLFRPDQPKVKWDGNLPVAE